MSFAALRASARRAAAFSAPSSRSAQAFRTSAFRKYSTEAPKKSSNTALLAGLGIAAVGGIALYVYSSSDTANEAGSALKSGAQSGKVAANFVPTKDDYQKVRVLLWLVHVPARLTRVFRSTTVLLISWTRLPIRNTMVINFFSLHTCPFD